MDEKDNDWIMHVVLNENEHTERLAKKLAMQNDGPVTVVDSKNEGVRIRDGVSYTNMEIAKETFDLPDKLYFYAYMDPKNRKTKRKNERK
ncbi:hypothetical protein [Sporosarcina sp. 6E9]|uniref:hypothetical protein n=1 Tax=Sporosarcina sp. 6E9 TaxID=2819235 RepID=UPI001B30DE2F|nr:hypothetical protein [Sporosarcina sp. 6E9]